MRAGIALIVSLVMFPGAVAADEAQSWAATALPGPGGPAAAAVASSPWPSAETTAFHGAAGGLALMLLLAPLYHRLDREAVVGHPLRRQVLVLIDARPGLSINRLARELGVDYRTARHHVDKLVAFGLVSVARRAGRCHVLPTAARGKLPAPPTPPLLGIVAGRPGLHLASAARAFGRAKSTTRWHVQRLEADGLVRVERDGGVVRLWPTDAGQRTWDARETGGASSAATVPGGPGPHA